MSVPQPYTPHESIEYDGEAEFRWTERMDRDEAREWWRWHASIQIASGLAASGRYDRSERFAEDLDADARSVASALIAGLEADS